MKKKVGAPFGNQNARKHGFYSGVLKEPDLKMLKQAPSVKGIDAEIDVLRVKLRAILRDDPDNIKLYSLAVVSLSRLLRTRLKLFESPEYKEKSIAASIHSIIENIGIPLGVVPIGKQPSGFHNPGPPASPQLK